MKILVLTGDTGVIASLRRLLAPNGHELDVSLSGEEALERAAAGNPRVVLVLEPAGVRDAFIARLRQQPLLAAVPVLPLSAEDIAQEDRLLGKINAAVAPRKVLIADDDRQMAHLLCLLLEKAGYQARTAYDGTEALEATRAWHPHLLVLDVMLPVIDGFHVCQTMNDDPSFEPLPRVLIISGRSSEWDQNLGAACGAEYYLVKPFSNAYFLEKVNEILRGEEEKNDR